MMDLSLSINISGPDSNIFFILAEVKKAMKEVVALTNTDLDSTFNKLISDMKNQRYTETLRMLKDDYGVTFYAECVMMELPDDLYEII